MIKYFHQYYPDCNKYIEGCAGGLSILLNRQPAPIEIAYDLDERIQDEGERLKHLLYLTEFSAKTFNAAKAREWEEGLYGAYVFIIKNRMSCMAFGRTFDSSVESIWRKTIPRIEKIENRIKRVKFIVGDIASHIPNDEQTFLYLDPPYIRAGVNMYTKEMSIEWHQQLLKRIRISRSKIMISGYHSILYDQELKNWERESWLKAVLCTKRKPKREEICWRNYG